MITHRKKNTHTNKLLCVVASSKQVVTLFLVAATKFKQKNVFVTKLKVSTSLSLLSIEAIIIGALVVSGLGSQHHHWSKNADCSLARRQQRSSVIRSAVFVFSRFFFGFFACLGRASQCGEETIWVHSADCGSINPVSHVIQASTKSIQRSSHQRAKVRVEIWLLLADAHKASY